MVYTVGMSSMHRNPPQDPLRTLPARSGRPTELMKSRRRRHAPAERAAKLEKANALAAEGRTQNEIADALGISVMTFHRWRKAQPPRHQEGLGPLPVRQIAPNGDLSEQERLNHIAELELENTRLRRIVTDLLLEKTILEEEAKPEMGRGKWKTA